MTNAIDSLVEALVGQLERAHALVAESRWLEAGEVLTQHDAQLRELFARPGTPEFRARLGVALRRVLDGERWLIAELERARALEGDVLSRFRRGRAGIDEYAEVQHG